MKKAFLIALLFVCLISGAFSFEIIVSDSRTDSISNKIRWPDDLKELEPGLAGLDPSFYGEGGVLFLSTPGLSSSHTSIIFNSLIINDPANGTVDLSTLPPWMLGLAKIIKDDTSSAAGSQGLGGALILSGRSPRLPGIEIFMDVNSFRLTSYLPAHTALGTVVFWYSLKEGGDNRANSAHLTQDLSLTFDLKGPLYVGVSSNRTDMGTPGPVPSAEYYQDDYTGPTSLYPENTYSGDVNRIIVSYMTETFSSDLLFESKYQEYLSYYYGSPYLSVLEDDFIKFSIAGELQSQGDLALKGNFAVDSQNYNGKKHSAAHMTLNTVSSLTGLGLMVKSDQELIRNRNHISWKLYWQPQLEDIDLNASLSYGIKLPSLNDLYFDYGGNEQLLPERGYSLFLSASYKAFNLEYKYLDIDKMIRWVETDPINYLYSAENSERISNHSVTLGFRYQFKDICIENTTILTAGKRHQGDFETVNEDLYQGLLRTPLFKNVSKISFHRGRFSAILTHLYKSSETNIYYNSMEKILPAMGVSDFKLSYDIGHGAITLGVKNLFDLNGAMEFGDSFYDGDYPMKRRTFFAEFSL